MCEIKSKKTFRTDKRMGKGEEMRERDTRIGINETTHTHTQRQTYMVLDIICWLAERCASVI